jgi:alkylation response protein AidB-like acyl-CoA dehydrogenase
VNRGWYVGTTTLDFERSGIGAAVGLQQAVVDLIKWTKEHQGDGQAQVHRNPVVRNELIDRYIDVNVSKMLAYRVVHMQNTGRIPNHEASMAKLFATELRQRVWRTAHRATGIYGLTWDRKSDYAPHGAAFAHSMVESVSSTIAGGTSEIQRNIIAQRGMGMPRD